MRLQDELDPLRQRKFRRPVDGCSLPPHVSLPGIAASFAAAASIFFTAERPADFRAAGTDIHIGDTAIATALAQKGLGRDQVGSEDSGRETLGNFVMPG